VQDVDPTAQAHQQEQRHDAQEDRAGDTPTERVQTVDRRPVQARNRRLSRRAPRDDDDLHAAPVQRREERLKLPLGAGRVRILSW
jgi:hypothetical protein